MSSDRADEPREGFILELERVLGRGVIQAGEASRLVYSYDATFQQRLPDVVVSPTTTEQVQAVLRVASRLDVPVITRGAGTSLSGGTIPTTGGIVLNLARMDRVLEIDKANGMAVVEPGVVNADFQGLVEAQGLFYPPDPASYRQSTLGGNVATNAGGPRGVKYGVTRDYVRGMDVVLADGTLLRLGGKIAKSATGYQLHHLFIGSEGTLGVITRLILRLIPLPQVQRTARALFATLEDASEGVAAVLGTGVLPVALELMDRTTLEVTADSLGFPLPDETQAMLIVEADGSNPDAVSAEIEAMARALRQARALQVDVAQTEEERDSLWRARRVVNAALGKAARERLGEDIVVPRARVPEMVQRIGEIGKEHGFRIAVFGHAGDGNLHPNFLFDSARPGEMERLERASTALFRAAIEMGGTLSGEHGIGTLKREFMEEAVGKEALARMRAIKALFDPKGILNPHKLFPSQGLPPDKSGFLTTLPTLKNATPG